METKNKLNIGTRSRARKEKQNNILINAKNNVGGRCYASQMRNNTNCPNYNNKMLAKLKKIVITEY